MEKLSLHKVDLHPSSHDVLKIPATELLQEEFFIKTGINALSEELDASGDTFTTMEGGRIVATAAVKLDHSEKGWRI